MCEFCKDILTGDDYNPILTVDLNFGIAGTAICDVVLMTKKKKPSLVLSIMDNENMEKGIPIKYCPMCGQKF